MWSEGTREAIRDLRYLLNRGYPRETAVRVVSNHYCLSSEERHLLSRCVFSREEGEKHRRKLVRLEGVRGKTLGVDGYNVLITCESLLEGYPVVRCDDGLLRDLRSVRGKYRSGEHTERALEEIALLLAEAEAREVRFLFDSPTSRSGELARRTAEVLEEQGVRAVCRATVGVDGVVGSCEVSASSDRVIVERARRVWDLPAELLERRGGRVLDLAEVSGP